MTENKNLIFVGLAVAVALIGVVAIASSGKDEAPPAAPVAVESSDPNLQGERAGLQNFTDGAKLGTQNTRWYSGTIAAGANQGFWLNNTGVTVYADLAEMITTGTASTSYDFFIGTTTAATLSSDFTDPFSGLVDDKVVATSTNALPVANSIKDAGTNGRGVVAVPVGAYVFFTFQQTFAGNCTGSLCETATSTNRGFDVNWNLRVHHTVR